jgi:hypothetical protein
MPIENGKLVNSLNGNQQSITNVSTIQIGSGTVTNNATTPTAIVNYRTLTNEIFRLSPEPTNKVDKSEFYATNNAVSLSLSQKASTNNVPNWDLAYGWGDHALAGYLYQSWFTNWLSTNGLATTNFVLDVLSDFQATNKVKVLYGDPNSWQTIENGTATVWRVQESIDINTVILTVTEPLTKDGGSVVLPVGVYSSFSVSPVDVIFVTNFGAFGYYVANSFLGLDSFLAYEDDSSAWYGHNGSTGVLDFPDNLINSFGTAISGKATIDYAYITVTNSYVLVTTDMQSAGGVTNHADLINRDAIDSHPIEAVTGLSDALSGKASTNNVPYWDLAYGWGDHALAGYLYQSWFTNWLSTNAYNNIKAEGVFRLVSFDNNTWATVSNNTLYVWSTRLAGYRGTNEILIVDTDIGLDGFFVNQAPVIGERFPLVDSFNEVNTYTNAMYPEHNAHTYNDFNTPMVDYMFTYSAFVGCQTYVGLEPQVVEGFYRLFANEAVYNGTFMDVIVFTDTYTFYPTEGTETYLVAVLSTTNDLSNYVSNSWLTNWITTNVFGVMVSASGGLTTSTNNGTVTVDGSSKVNTNDTRYLQAVTNNQMQVDFGNLSLSTLALSLNYIPTGSEGVGTLYWDSASMTTVIVYPNKQQMNIGEEFCIPGQNNTGADIPDGTIVMWTGEIGNSGNIRIAPAYVTISTDVHRILGMTTTVISNGLSGKVTRMGKVRGVRTDGDPVGEVWVNASEIYVTTNPVYAGKGTIVKPEAPYPAIRIAKVVNSHPSMGTYQVCIEYPTRLTDLVDVDGTPLITTGQIPVYDSVRGVFDFNYNYVAGTNLIWVGLGGKVSTNDVKYLNSVTNNQTSVSLNLVGPNNGFEHQDAQTLSFDPSTRVLTISPTGTSFKVTSYGVSYTCIGDQTSPSAPLSPDMYFYYGNDGALIATNVAWTISGEAQIAYVKYDTNNLSVVFTTDERHGVEWADSLHRQQHLTIGSKHSSGMSLFHNAADTTVEANANGSNTCVSIEGGVMYDEDVRHVTFTNGVQQSGLVTTNNSGRFPVLYKTEAGTWAKTNRTEFPFLWSGNVPQIVNASGSRVNVVEDQYFVYWIVTIGGFDGTNMYLLPHPTTFTSTANAQNGTSPANLGSLLGGLPSPEILACYRLIFLYNVAGANNHPASVKGTKLRVADDFRHLSSGVIVSGVSGTPGEQDPVWALERSLYFTIADMTASNWVTRTWADSNLVSSSYSSTNRISSIWRGSYSNYLALVERSDSTTYFIDDDNLVYDTTGIYQEKVTYITPVAPASLTTTVQIVSDKAIYQIDVTTNTTFVFDTSSLDFSNKVVTVEFFFNYGSTNYSMTFPSYTYFVSGTPNFTTNCFYYFSARFFATNSLHMNLMYYR